MYGLEPEKIEQIVYLSNTHTIEAIAKMFHRGPARIRHIIAEYSDMND